MPTFELTHKDGRTFEVEAATPADAQKAFDYQFGGPRPGGSFATGINDTLAAAAGAPMDISAWLGNQLGRGVNAITGRDIFQQREAIGGSDQIRRGLEATVGRTEPTQSMIDQLAYGAGQGVGGTVAGMGAGGGLSAAGRAPTLARALMGPTGGAAANVGMGAASGVGQVAGEELAGDDPLARTLGGMAGGLAPGLLAAGGALMRGAPRLRAPSEQELMDAGRGGYDEIADTGMTIAAKTVSDMGHGALKNIRGKVLDRSAPDTIDEMRRLALRPPSSAYDLPLRNIDVSRGALSGISADRMTSGRERLAAGMGVRSIDDMLNNLQPRDIGSIGNPLPGQMGPPDPGAIGRSLADTRANYAAAQRSNRITGDLDVANTGVQDQALARASGANSGTNIDNTIRQKLIAFRQNRENLAGFSPEEVQAIDKVIAGGPMTNFARVAANRLGGGVGMGPAIGAGLGAAAFGPGGAVAGAGATGILGRAIRGMENRSAVKGLEGVSELIRQRSPLFQQMLEAHKGTPLTSREETVLRALMPGLLSMFAEQQSPIPGLLGP